MQHTPLGQSEEVFKDRNNVPKLEKTKEWKKGYKAGKHGKHEHDDNPYTLPSDVWELLKKRTRWIYGFQEGYAARKKKHQHKKDKKEQLAHIKDISKKKHRKHKHHHGHKH